MRFVVVCKPAVELSWESEYACLPVPTVFDWSTCVAVADASNSCAKGHFGQAAFAYSLRRSKLAQTLLNLRVIGFSVF